MVTIVFCPSSNSVLNPHQRPYINPRDHNTLPFAFQCDSLLCAVEVMRRDVYETGFVLEHSFAWISGQKEDENEAGSPLSPAAFKLMM